MAVSYLIIIGDLMPQVVGSIFPSAKSMPFLLDRQFWITAFMCLTRTATANDMQASDNPAVFPATTRLIKVYFDRRIISPGLSGSHGRGTLHHGRHC